ncbi:MAG: hypothetical protein IJ187_03650 [Neisseriaceae bacterium]|nr:hypothetical protein [Neisseriaceae bacterium]
MINAEQARENNKKYAQQKIDRANIEQRKRCTNYHELSQRTKVRQKIDEILQEIDEISKNTKDRYCSVPRINGVYDDEYVSSFEERTRKEMYSAIKNGTLSMIAFFSGAYLLCRELNISLFGGSAIGVVIAFVVCWIVLFMFIFLDNMDRKKRIKADIEEINQRLSKQEWDAVYLYLADEKHFETDCLNGYIRW